MKEFREYWTFLSIRGALTIIAAVGIVGAPVAASAMLSVPVWLRLGVDFLATYMVIDATVLILLNRMLPKQARRKNALYLQAGVGLAAGVVLYLMVYGIIGTASLAWVVAGALLLAAAAEVFVAQDTHLEYGCVSCYTTAIVLAACGIALPFASGLGAESMCQVLAGVVGLYGLSQFVVAARMLFLEYRSEHPAAVMSEEWRTMMEPSAHAALPQRKIALVVPARQAAVPGEHSLLKTA
jgi:hypothetical protein